MCPFINRVKEEEGENEGEGEKKEEREGRGIEANMENGEIAFCSSKEKPGGRLPM